MDTDTARETFRKRANVVRERVSDGTTTLPTSLSTDDNSYSKSRYGLKAAITDSTPEEAYAVSITTEERTITKEPDVTRPSARDWMSSQMIIKSPFDAFLKDKASRSLDETNGIPLDDGKRRGSVILTSVLRSIKSENSLDEEEKDKQEEHPSVSLVAQPSAADSTETVTLRVGPAVAETRSSVPEPEASHDTVESYPTPDPETGRLNMTTSAGNIVIRFGAATPRPVAEMGSVATSEVIKGSKAAPDTAPPLAKPPAASPKPPAPSLTLHAPLPINEIGQRPSPPHLPANHKRRANKKAKRRAKRRAKRKAKKLANLVPSP